MDVSALREEFPITRNYNFLNHASVAPLPRRAVGAVREYLEHQLNNSYVRGGYRRKVEHAPTEELFVTPKSKETADYIEGRYG